MFRFVIRDKMFMFNVNRVKGTKYILKSCMRILHVRVSLVYSRALVPNHNNTAG